MMMGFGFIFFILLIAGAIMFFTWIYKGREVLPIKTAGSNNSLDILKHRYARGEITKKEFESIKNDII